MPDLITSQKRQPLLPQATQPFYRFKRLQWPLAVLFGLVALSLAYQAQPHVFRLEVGNPGDSPYLAGFYQEEKNPAFDYRWSRRESYVNLPYPGTPYDLSFRAVTARPDNQPLEVTVIANGKELGRIKVEGQPQIFTLRGNNSIFGPEELALTFRSASTFAEKGGRGELGFALDWVEVRAAKNRLGLTLPTPFVLAWWLLTDFGFWILAFRISTTRFRSFGLPSSLFFLGIICLLYLLPEPANYLLSNWFTAGIQLGLAQLALLIGIAVWRRREEGGKRKEERGERSFFTGAGEEGERVPSGKARKSVHWWQSPGWLLFCGLILLYLATARGRMSYGDDVTMEAVTANITAGKPAAPINAYFSDLSAIGPVHSKYGLGQSLVGVPFYAVGDTFAKALPFMLSEKVGERGLVTYVTLFTGAIITAGTALTLYWLLLRLGYGRWVAFGVGSLFGVTTMAWHYARTYFSEPLVMLCLSVALASSLVYSQEKRLRWVGLSGFVLGLAVAARSFNLAVLPLFGIFLMIEWWKTGHKVAQGLKLALAWALPLASWLVVVGWWNWARFGTPFEAGYGSEADAFNTPLLKGLYGELFSPGKSIFLYNPILVLALAGLPLLWRRKNGPGLIGLIGGITLAYLVVYGMWHDWHGGGVWGPRYLAPLLPFLMVPLAPVLQLLGGLWQKGRLQLKVALLALLSLVTIALSFGVQLLSVIINYQVYAAIYGKDDALFQRMVFNLPDSPILKHLELWQQGDRPDFAPRFYHDTPFARFTGTFQSATWLLFLALLAFALLVYITARHRERGTMNN